MMSRKLAVLVVMSLTGLSLQAATIYTATDGVVVLDKPTAIGSTVIATLKSETMIETIKRVGSFTEAAVVVDGKVRTGFISTRQLESSPPGTLPVGAGESRVGNDMTSAPEGPLAMLDGIHISDTDLAAFAKNGQLNARKSKSSAKAAR